MVVAHQNGEECKRISDFQLPIGDLKNFFQKVSIGNWQSEIGNYLTQRMKGLRKRNL